MYMFPKEGIQHVKSSQEDVIITHERVNDHPSERCAVTIRQKSAL